MAQFFKPQPKPVSSTQLELRIDSLDHHGVGIGRHQGKALFVEGALPGERVRVRIREDRKQYALAELLQVLQPAAERCAPFCPHYAACGGCSLQHLPLPLQQQAKSKGVQSLFQRLAGEPLGEPDFMLQGEARAYRRVCRLAIKYDKKARCARLGFRRRQSTELVEVDACPVLVSSLSALIEPLRQLCNQLKSFRDLGHVELYQTEGRPLVLLRHNGQPGERDRALMLAFAEQRELDFYLQTEGEPEPLRAEARPYYQLGELQLHYQPGDFLQVNAEVNAALVEQVLTWLAPTSQDKVLDLFCGLGNFTLPLARQAAEVVGVEGVLAMVRRARDNAAAAGLSRVRFHQADLSQDIGAEPWAREHFDLVLLDPARPGAQALMPFLVRQAPRRIVYVSCNPVTAARDSAQLLAGGYRLSRWGLLDMFPHTGHVETILLFELPPKSQR